MFTHNIYHNVRTRVIIVHKGRMLLHAVGEDLLGGAPFRTLPGGGLEPNESLYEGGEREVFEETGLRAKVTSVAFLREWIVPKMVSADEMRRQADASGFSYDEKTFPDHGYGLEVYLWAELPEGEPVEPRPGDDNITGGLAEWLPLEQVAREPLFPAELKALARDLAEDRAAMGVPSFVSGLGSPWEEPDWEAFRRG